MLIYFVSNYLCLLYICIVSIPYYVFNIRAVVKLSRKMYFEKGPWIALVQQNMKIAKAGKRVAL